MTLPRDRLLFLNPPGRRVYLRDYFCSKVSQADYIHHPIDFVFLSGFLKGSFELHLVDAIVERLDGEECIERVRGISPRVIVGLTGSVSYDEDVAFYRRLSERNAARLILIGDILIERRKERLEGLPFVEAFLHDFSGDDVLRYLSGSDPDRLRNMTVRRSKSVEVLPLERPNGQALLLPVPQHGLFQGKPYRYPFVRRRRFATLMTDFGCPYTCTFCIMSTLGWKLRPIASVIEELEQLDALGVRELFFLDQTFGIPRPRALELLARMSELPRRFGWVAFSRPDVLDAELVKAMKAAGAHTVILGLESGSQKILDDVRKDYRKDEIKAGFRLASELGLRTVATVLLGLPHETEETFEETLSFLKEVDPDFASFNVAVPRMGTPLRDRALSLGLIEEACEMMDQSGSEVAMPSLALSRQQVASLRRRAIRDFYFRFGYFKKRLTNWFSTDGAALDDLRIQVHQGLHLLKNYWAT